MSNFENDLRNAVNAGRKLAEELADKYDPSQWPELEPEDEGMSDTEILLQITGQKTLSDPEEQEVIVDTYKDAFYGALEELRA